MQSNVPPELEGVSVKDLVRVIGESRTNGNASPAPSPGAERKSGRNSRSQSASPMVTKVDSSSFESDLSQRSRSLSPAVAQPVKSGGSRIVEFAFPVVNIISLNSRFKRKV